MQPIEPTDPSPPLAEAAPALPPDAWTPPPPRAVRLHAWTSAAGWLLLAAVPLAIFFMAADSLALATRIGIIVGCALLALAFGGWIGARLRHQRWRLDATGLWLRQGNLWRAETRMPASRVQHLDVKHGPLERRARLATLVLHTAGTRLTAVTVRGLEEHDAQRLRDALSRQVDDER